MTRHRKSGKRTHSSTSDFDSNTSIQEETNSTEEGKDRKKKKKKTIDETQPKLDNFLVCEGGSQSDGVKMEQKLNEISEKLSNMLTKNDNTFIKRIIKETLEEIKENFLGAVIKRLEILEGEIHEKAIETGNLRKEINEKTKHIEKLTEDNTLLKRKLGEETSQRQKDINELEQYGRRNNVRISGISDDKDKQQSATVASLVIKTLNEKGDLQLHESDIDIAHRLGKWVKGKSRTVIVRFVRRQTKIQVMKIAKQLRPSEIFINEDLTHLNQQVLASLRLKDPDKVEKCWSFEGKLYALFYNNTVPTEIQFQDYNEWLDKPWPKKG